MRLTALFAAIVLLGAAPAVAAADEAAKPAAIDRQMIAPNIVTPVVRDGKLVNYLFVTVEVDFTNQANAMKLRDRAHFLRDALLRASHRTSMADPLQDNQVNKAAAEAAFRLAANEALGAENVKSVTVTGVDSLRRR
jgi:flagellar basal body-associated protein FliL